MTNEPNVYLERSDSAGSALRRRLPGFACGFGVGSRSGVGRGGSRTTGSPSATRKRTETPGSAAIAARRTSSAKWPSIQARVNSFGTPTSSTSPSSASALVVENQAPKTMGERSSRMRSATAVQSRAGVEESSTGIATHVHGAGGCRSTPCGRGEGCGC